MLFGWSYLAFGWMVSPLGRRLWVVGVLTPISLAVLAALMPLLLAVLAAFVQAGIDGFDPSAIWNLFHRWADRHEREQWITPALRYVDQLSVPNNRYWSNYYGPNVEPTFFQGPLPFFLTSWASTAVVFLVLWANFRALARGPSGGGAKRFEQARA
jgi:hypothetical protein